VRRFDWIGVTALIAGLATPLYIPNWIVGADDNPWWHPWLLPSYAIGFLVCLLGRAVQRAAGPLRADAVTRRTVRLQY
jgi:hypothetical protein